VIGLSGAVPADAVNNNPPGNVTSPVLTYESDCTSALAPGQVAPFITSTSINTTTDTQPPAGAISTPPESFGVSGTITQVLPGPLLAGLNQNLNPTTIAIGVTQTFGSTDGRATGTATYSHTFEFVHDGGGAVSGVTFASGATTLSGNFSGVPSGQSLSGTGIPASAITTAPGTATGITISAPTTAAVAAPGETIGWSQSAGTGFTDTFATAANAFTTNGPNGTTAGIGISSTTSFSFFINGTFATFPTGSPIVTFGGTPGVGTQNCLETGWVNATTPGPSQTGETTPALPFGTTTALLAATPAFQPGAYVNLVDTVTPQNQSVQCAVGGTCSVTLTATGAYPPFKCNLVGGSPQTITLTGGGTLTLTEVTGGCGTVNLSNTATAATSATFLFSATDSLPAANGGPVTNGPAQDGVITVSLGTPPLIQPFGEQVNGAQLVLSCNSPANYVTGNNTPTPTAAPLTQCPEFQFQPITLDGLEQQTTATTGNTGGVPSASNPGTIYISDNRGSPTGMWTFTGTFTPTPVGAANGQNPNASCAGVDAFCNSSVGAAALNTATNGAHDGQIAPNYLQVGAITCVADSTGGPAPYNPPNLNPNATPTTGGSFGSPVNLCSASAGQSGGTFIYNATYTLTIPESVYAGNYIGSVAYTVA
jgi:hypothetical protein